jgi:hypothetical protein
MNEGPLHNLDAGIARLDARIQSLARLLPAPAKQITSQSSPEVKCPFCGSELAEDVAPERGVILGILELLLFFGLGIILWPRKVSNSGVMKHKINLESDRQTAPGQSEETRKAFIHLGGPSSFDEGGSVTLS